MSTHLSLVVCQTARWVCLHINELGTTRGQRNRQANSDTNYGIQ